MNNQEILGMKPACEHAKQCAYGANMSISAALVVAMGKRIAELEAMLAYWKRTTHVEMKREVEPSLQVLNRGRVRDEGWMRKLRWSKAND